MSAAVERADLRPATVSGPTLLALATLELEVEEAVVGAIRQTLPGLLVELLAALALPALLADALALHAEAVAGAVGVGAVGWK